MKLLLLSTITTTTVHAFLPPLPHHHHISHYNNLNRQALSTDNNNEQQQKQSNAVTEVLDEANEALTKVGWSVAPPPLMEEGELTSDDPFVQQIDEGIRNDFGVGLNDLLNPAKVVNLERDLYNLRLELASLTGNAIDASTVSAITTEMIDGGGGGKNADAIRSKIDKKERDLLVERRAVFRSWLKNVFLIQAVISLVFSWVMVTDPSLVFGSFSWFNEYQLDMPIRVLGFWWWWLFIVPSLRSRRPAGLEKKALDIAFIGTPLISLVAPVVTKDPAQIWLGNFIVTAGAYAYTFGFAGAEEYDDGDDNTPSWLKFVYKSLDFGSGRERGARK